MQRQATHTIGHSTRSQLEFLGLLTAAGIEAVADVRAYPSSRRHPHFNRSALAGWLSDAGLAYVHFPELGGRRRPRPDSINGGWREQQFRGYADHLATPEFAGGLERLEGLAHDRATVIMCAEAVWWRCHRRLIADALLVRGWRVWHLGVGDVAVPHELTPFAVLRDGELTYPPAQLPLG